FHALGVKTTIVNLEEDHILESILKLSEEQFDAVLSFNCFISSVKLSNGSYLQDYIQAPYYYFLLDHPMHHHIALKEKLHNFHALCVDNYFVEYIQNYYPHIRSVHTVLHGGCYQRSPVAYGKRNIDVLFTGTYKPCDKLLQLMQDSEEPANQISIALAEEILSHPALRQEEAFAKVLQKLGITLTNEQFSEWLHVVGNLVDHYIRGIYRNRLLETMAGQDYRVEVYGEGWEKCTIQADNIHFHPAVGFEENLKLMTQSKIVINTYTGFKSGAHERVFSAMLSKALCLSERNDCLENLFSENQEIIFFDYRHLENLNSILHHYLTNVKLAEQITECAYQTVVSQHTWNERAQEIVEIISHK
ncbi:MAG: glycosyltransferase, partial [Lachnospiraceae bacterium]|nr:glycosyltransferase [Lachnospiraceae bacterium]